MLPHYCEIPVKEKVKGLFNKTKERMQGFMFSNLAWYLLYEDYGWDFEQIPKVNPKELMAKMVYNAARVANWDKGLPAQFTLDQMAQWINDCPTAYTEVLRETYQKAMTVISEEWKERGDSLKKKTTWDDIIALAFGGLKLDPVVFWYRMSWRDWILCQRGYFDNKKADMRQAWEVGRMIAYFAVKPHVKKGSLQKITDIMHFEWDHKEIKVSSREEVDYIVRKYGRYYNETDQTFSN